MNDLVRNKSPVKQFEYIDLFRRTPASCLLPPFCHHNLMRRAEQKIEVR